MTAILCLLQAEEKQRKVEKPIFAFTWAIISAASFPKSDRIERYSVEVERIKGKQPNNPITDIIRSISKYR